MQCTNAGMRRHLLFALLLIAACSRTTADQASSWVATLQFTGEQWLAGRVPTSFVRATIDSGDRALQKMKAPVAPAARAAAEEMRQAIDRNDRAAVARLVKRFASLHAST